MAEFAELVNTSTFPGLLGVRIHRNWFTVLAFPYVDANEVFLVPFSSGSVCRRVWKLGGQLHLVYAVGGVGTEIDSAEIRREKCASKGDAVFSGVDIGAIYHRESMDDIGHGV